MERLVSVSHIKKENKKQVLRQLPILLFEEHREGLKTSKISSIGGLSVETMGTLLRLHIVYPSPMQIVVVKDLHKVGKG